MDPKPGVSPKQAVKPQAVKPQDAKGVFVHPKGNGNKKKDNSYEIIEVPSIDVSIEEWSMCDRKLKPGQDIKIMVTIRNLSSKTISTDQMHIRVEKDLYFQAGITIVKKSISPAGEITVPVTLKAKGGITNLHTLPPKKEIMLVKDESNNKLIKISSIYIVIPIDPFVRYLKEVFVSLRLQLWGLFGTGKSSFINSIATLFNEDERFPNKKLSPAFSRPASTTVTNELKSYTVNNITLIDSWGWEEARQTYNDLLFQLMLGGRLGTSFKMEKAGDINVLNLPSGKTDKVDMVLFFITCAAVDNGPYLEQVEHYIKEARKLDIPFLVLLTQIDKVEPSLKQDPYCINPTIQDLVTKVCLKIEQDESFVVPVVNYTKEAERNWPMDRAAFVTLYRAFQRCEEAKTNL
jgi:predicted GTPase